ncbi:HAD-IA family hydrolase [bacterium]|nr:HAD-IA family hydrolase [bacterium]
MTPLQAIFFDIDDTLYSTSEFARQARLNSVQAMIAAGLKMSPDDCYKEYLETIEEFGSNFSSHIDKMLLRIPSERYDGVNPAVIVAAGVVAYHRTKALGLLPYPDVTEVFKLLAKTELIVGITTEGLQIKQAEKLVRLGLLEYIDPRAIFITDQIGIGKTNPKFYQRACVTLKLSPKHCAQVGDNPLKDIDPPKKAGLLTFLCRRSGKYLTTQGQTQPDHIVNTMWDVLEILRTTYNIEI